MYGTITEDTLGTPAPSPAHRRENLRDPLADTREIHANRRTDVLHGEVIRNTVHPTGAAGSNLVLTVPAPGQKRGVPRGTRLHPPPTQESPQ
ncbi:hypothetical protein GCM10010421_52620 [Streptomyces glaucus]|uniref:Uncharacterized protein n=1 Tax=Streptomyces glaucus TaxID=284029 RepID=A0ABN3K985_9ACTN